MVYNILNSGSYQAKLAMLRTKCIAPPDGTVMGTVTQIDDGHGNMVDPTTVQWAKVKMTSLKHIVGFIKFEPGVKEATGGLTFKFKPAVALKKNNERVGWIPCWYLPWDAGHIVKLKIQSMATDNGMIRFNDPSMDDIPNPGLFFTAAINGCSVIAVGNPGNPSVYHAGSAVGQGLPLHANEVTEQAWLRLLNRTGKMNTMGSVGKTDYISERSSAHAQDTDRIDAVWTDISNSGVVSQRTEMTTRRAKQLQYLLETNNQLTNISVKPWGAVFGLRDANGDWSMTLVRNAQVNYQKIKTVKKGPFGLGGTKTVTYGEKRLVDLGRTGSDVDWAKTAAAKPVQQHEFMMTSNLGFKEFFPANGAGVANYVDLPQIAII